MNPRSFTFAIERGGLQKSLFKLSLPPRKAELYFSFPYFSATSWHCGTVTIPSGQHAHTFNAVAGGTASSVPVKFSYHLSGAVHFKPNSSGRAGLPESYKLAALAATPIVGFSGEHFFTVEVEGIERFADLVPRRRSDVYSVTCVPPDAQRIKVVGYAGYAEAQIRAVLGLERPFLKIEIGRETLPRPLIVGIDVKPYREALDAAGGASLIALVGFTPAGRQPDQELRSLYLLSRQS